jgi:hypothetical protein
MAGQYLQSPRKVAFDHRGFLPHIQWEVNDEESQPMTEDDFADFQL